MYKQSVNLHTLPVVLLSRRASVLDGGRINFCVETVRVSLGDLPF